MDEPDLKAAGMSTEELALLQTVFDTLPDHIYAKNTQSRFVLCNTKIMQLMGADTMADVIGKTDTDFFAPHVAKQFHADDQTVIKTGQPLLNRLEHYLDPLGQPRWMLTSKVPWRDQAGQMLGLIGISRDITDRKQIEDSVAAEYDLLRTLINNLPDLIFVKDTQGRFVINNNMHLRVLEVDTQASVIGKTVFNFYPQAVAEQFWKDDQLVLTSGRPIVEREELVIRPNGDQRWHLTTKVPLFDSQGNVTGLMGISRDITKQKQADHILRQAHDELEMRVLDRTAALAKANYELQLEIVERRQGVMALRQSEQRYKQLLGSVTDYIYTVYIEDNRVARTIHSPNCVAVTGYTAKEYEVNPNLWYQMIYEPDRAAVLNQISRLISEERVPPLEHRIVHKDGSVRWVRNTPVLRTDKDGNLVSYDGLITDITERKEADEALRRSESKYRLLMEHASDGIIIIDRDAHILKTNSKIAELLAFNPEELFGLNFSRLLAQDTPSLQLELDDLLTGKTLLREVVLKSKKGTSVPVEVSARMIEPDRILAIIRDITERKEVERRERLAHNLGRQLTTLLNPTDLLTETVNRLMETFGYYHAHVYLLEPLLPDIPPRDRQLVVQEGTGEAGAALKQQGHAIPLNAKRSLVARAARLLEPVVVNDVNREAGHLPNPLLAQTRSEVALPLHVGRQLIGVLDVQHSSLNHFTPSEVRTLQIVASQLSVALANAQLFEEQRRLLEKVKAGQQRLQVLSHRLVEVQEAERRHIARELHDQVGQLLTGLKLTLEMSAKLPPQEITASLAEPKTLVNELIAQVRELSLELRPAMLDDLGLLPTLQWHFERYTAQTGITTHLEHSGLAERFSAAVETAAYRIIQESLTNVARHAGIADVFVKIWTESGRLNMQIFDKGAGFDIDQVQAAVNSSGLSGMHERAGLLGGQLTVTSSPQAGTWITAHLPLAPVTASPA